MPAWIWVLIAIAAVLVVAYLAVRIVQGARLRRHFGAEYERTLDESGSRRKAEAELRGRTRRRRSLEIVPLSDGARRRYTEAWRTVQTRFVDRPADAVREADVLVTEVMRERGYPMDDFEQQAADVSVDHPEVVSNFRQGHAIKERCDRGGASTEDLRQAMVHYRGLFEELLGDRVSSVGTAATDARRTAPPAPARPDRVTEIPDVEGAEGEGRRVS
jgi:hypothetical protein